MEISPDNFSFSNNEEESIFFPIPSLNDDSFFIDNIEKNKNLITYTPGISQEKNLINKNSEISFSKRKDNENNEDKQLFEIDNLNKNNIENNISKFDFSTLISTDLNISENCFLYGKKKIFNY